MKIKELNNKKIVILGLGLEGLAALRWIRKYLPNQMIALADQHSLDKLSEQFQEVIAKDGNLVLHLGTNYLDAMVNYEVIIRSPGINPRFYGIEHALERGAILTSGSKLFFDNVKGKTIAITGSKGKSTTATLICEMLKAGGFKSYLIGNIGNSALDYLEYDTPETYFVVEMSSYQLDDFRGAPDVAVFLSFFPEHLDYHRSVENYFEAKSHLFQYQGPNSLMVYNGNNHVIAKFAENAKARKVDYLNMTENKILPQIMDKKTPFIELDDNLVIKKAAVKVLGNHNLENIVCAATVAKAVGVPNTAILEAIEHFAGLRHRLELVGEYKGISFYDDAISTTPESTIAAIDCFDSRIGTLIVGGLDRGYDFEELARKIIHNEIENLICFPGSGEKIAQTVRKLALDEPTKQPTKVFYVQDMKAAVEQAYRITAKGKICLLSTASPSYNLFKNFEEKGEKFAQFVKQMA